MARCGRCCQWWCPVQATGGLHNQPERVSLPQATGGELPDAAAQRKQCMELGVAQSVMGPLNKRLTAYTAAEMDELHAGWTKPLAQGQRLEVAERESLVVYLVAFIGEFWRCGGPVGGWLGCSMLGAGGVRVRSCL